MTSYDFRQVDVFSTEPLRGNPVAVVHGADGLSDEEMRAFARWTQPATRGFLHSSRLNRPFGSAAWAASVSTFASRASMLARVASRMESRSSAC